MRSVYRANFSDTEEVGFLKLLFVRHLLGVFPCVEHIRMQYGVCHNSPSESKGC